MSGFSVGYVCLLRELIQPHPTFFTTNLMGISVNQLTSFVHLYNSLSTILLTSGNQYNLSNNYCYYGMKENLRFVLRLSGTKFLTLIMKQNKPFSRFHQNIKNSLRDGYTSVRRYNYFSYPCSLSMQTLWLS